MKWLTHLPIGGLLLALTPVVLADGDPQRLTAGDPATDQWFGFSTDTSGDVIVVGAPGDDDLGPYAGAVYIFERQAGVWVQVLKLTAPDGAEGHRFGHDVALDDGLLAVAANGRVAGSVTGGVYVFSRVGSSWVYETVIVAPPVWPCASDVRFALDVEVSGGKVAVRGSCRDEYSVLNARFNVFSNQGAWGEEFATRGYGRMQMGFGGDALVRANPNYDLPFAVNGAAQVFDYDAASGQWAFGGSWYGDGSFDQDGFGGAVAVDGDAQRAAVVAETDTPVTGAVYLYQRIADEWEREARVVALSGGRPGTYFGAALALSGDWMLLPWGNGVLVFRNDGTEWVEDRLLPTPPGAGYFGSVVRCEGSTAVVGAYRYDGLAPDIGAVFVYELDPPVSRYCPSTINSTGQAARIDASGTMSIAANDTTMTVTHCPVGTFGLFFYGQQAANLPLGDGRLCVSPFAPGLFRILPVVQANQDGSATMVLDFLALSAAGQIQGGDTWNFQCWFRDSAPGGRGSNLSDAIQVTFCQ